MSTNSVNPDRDGGKISATATHTQVDPSRVSGASPDAPGGVSRSTSTSSTTDKRSKFRQRVGIIETGELPNQTFRSRIEKAYHAQTRYYYFVASLSHGMLWLQIGIGATVTALASTNSNTVRVAITILGAINTVVAGFLTFLKSRNQPNRALQFRNALRGVYEDLWQVDSEMMCNRENLDVDKKVDLLWEKYKEARAEAEANYPDLWVSLGKLTRSHDPDKNANSQLDEVSVPPERSNESNRAAEASEPLLPKTRP